MKVLGKIPARTLIHFGAVEMSTVIILCYVLAVSLGHVKPWLPTISACGEHAPEKYPFRFGISLGATMLFIEALALHGAKWSSKVTFALGAVAAVCLGIVAAVQANEDDIVHSTAAVVFFVFEDIMSVMLTFDLVGRITRMSTFIKTISATVACISTIGRLMILSNQFSMFDSFPALAIVEWTNTIAITVYQLSLANDVNILDVGDVEIDQDSEQGVSSSSGKPEMMMMTTKPSVTGSGVPQSKKEMIMQLERADV